MWLGHFDVRPDEHNHVPPHDPAARRSRASVEQPEDLVEIALLESERDPPALQFVISDGKTASEAVTASPRYRRRGLTMDVRCLLVGRGKMGGALLDGRLAAGASIRWSWRSRRRIPAIGAAGQRIVRCAGVSRIPPVEPHVVVLAVKP